MTSRNDNDVDYTISVEQGCGKYRVPRKRPLTQGQLILVRIKELDAKPVIKMCQVTKFSKYMVIVKIIAFTSLEMR